MNKKLKAHLKKIGLGIIIGVVAAAGLFCVKLYLHGKLLPGTIIAGVSVGYLPPAEAVQLLKEKEGLYFLKPIKISVDGKQAEISPQEVDLKYLIEDTVASAGQIDFSAISLPYALTHAGDSPSLEMLFTFNSDKLKEIIDVKFDLKALAPKNAEYAIESGKSLVVTEEKAGKVVNYEEAIKKTSNGFAFMEPVEVALKLKEAKPMLSKTELEAAKDSIEAKLRQKLKIKYDDKKWDFVPIDHTGMMIFAKKDSIKIPVGGLEIGLDATKKPQPDASTSTQPNENILIFLSDNEFDSFVSQTLAPDVEVKIEPIDISKDSTGKIIFKGNGVDGISIQRGVLKKSLELAVNDEVAANNEPVEIQLYTKQETAPVTVSGDLQKMGIKELISTGHTTFYGSPKNRIYNIKVGLSKFDGLLIAPGAEFSFNKNLGEVDESTGYKKELVIKKEGTIPEYGGGICQVSSTAYRAAIFAGLPVTDRAPHSYAVSYYAQTLGYGLDATVYLGGQDLKFINDTGNNILIHSYSDGSHAYFKFYGASDGRRTVMDGPILSNYYSAPDEIIYTVSPTMKPGEKKQIEKRHAGFQAFWTRTIYKADGTVKKEEIHSKYKATQNKFLVGPDSI